MEEVLDLVNCKVLRYAQSDTTDTYVLSESSMFVFRTHLVLKTCGETTLLHAIQPLLGLARDYCGFDVVDVRKMRINTLQNLIIRSFVYLSKFIIVAENFFVLNYKKHHTQVSTMK